MRGLEGSFTHVPSRRLRSAGRSLALVALVAVALSACGTAASDATPSPVPTATPTPDPHLADPATVKQVYTALIAAGLDIVPNTATTNGPTSEPRTKVNTTFDGWPLTFSEFSSAAALARSGFTSGEAPGSGAAPYAFAGLNILVQYGPVGSGRPAAPADRYRTAAQRLTTVLDPLLGPLGQVAVVPIPLTGPSPSP